MRRSLRARTARRPLPHNITPRRAMPPTPAPVRTRALGRDRVSPSTSVPGAVAAMVALLTLALTASGLVGPLAVAPEPVPPVVAAAESRAPVPDDCAAAVHPVASFGSTWQSVRSAPTAVGLTVPVVVVVVV